ncbi:MAG: GDP-L-fucose synthase [Lentimicrobium sp.]|jgi:GDP-L-fucose synthase|nr:GDP-L-fucose synthase [Lentimicrobium sp.]
MDKKSKVYLAGHRGLVGSAILRNLTSKGYTNIVTKTHAELDLANQQVVQEFFEVEQPEYVFLAAAKVGGIMANSVYRAQFIYENLQIQNNVIHAAYLNGVKKLLFLGSSCVYPKNAPQPMKEDDLLTSPLEYTNEPYAIAKIAGLKMCEAYNAQYGTDYISVMPTNLYGPNDNYSLENSHVLPALLRKIYLSKCLQENNLAAIRRDIVLHGSALKAQHPGDDEIISYLEEIGIRKVDESGVVELSLWGTGSPLREFLWSEDMADACVFLMENYSFQEIKNLKYKGVSREVRNMHINIGSGVEVSIKDLALLIQNIVGYEGTISFDLSRPDGTPRKLLDVSRLTSLGWKSKVSLQEGIRKIYEEYSK